MKFSAQEEYGLRCLLQLGRQGPEESLTIAEIAKAEGLSTPYVAKLMGMLRKSGFVESTRGQSGGYTLSKPAEKIVVGNVLGVLGGRLYDKEFCDRYSGMEKFCTHTIDCSIRSLWANVQDVLDQVLGRTTLQDMLCNEKDMESKTGQIVSEVLELKPEKE